MRRLLSQLMPFLLIGVSIVVFAFGIMLLAYLFIFGAIVGLILYVFTWIREKFFPSKIVAAPVKKAGRTFDSKTWTEL